MVGGRLKDEEMMIFDLTFVDQALVLMIRGLSQNEDQEVNLTHVMNHCSRAKHLV